MNEYTPGGFILGEAVVAVLHEGELMIPAHIARRDDQ